MGENPGMARARLRRGAGCLSPWGRAPYLRPRVLGLAWGLFFLDAPWRMALWLHRAPCGFLLLQCRLAQPRVVFFGLQPFLGDFPARPLGLEPLAQPAGRRGEEPRATPRPTAWPLEEDHGN